MIRVELINPLNNIFGLRVLGGPVSDATPEALKGNLYQCPLQIKWEDESTWWRLPLDPVVSVQGGNSIVRQTCLKHSQDNYERRGTIKEIWGQDDYDIQIAGVLIGETDYAMPEEELRRLRSYCEGRRVVEVDCELLRIFGITRMVIEKYDFQHTPGKQNQQFAIKAYSDDDFSLLIKK